MTITPNPLLINGKPYAELSESEKREAMEISDAITRAMLVDN